MTGLRVALGLIGAAAAAEAVAVGRPAVFLPLALLAIAAFMLAAGCLAADLLPLRPVYAATSGLALLDALLLALADRVSRPAAVVTALALVALSAAPRLIRARE